MYRKWLGTHPHSRSFDLLVRHRSATTARLPLAVHNARMSQGVQRVLRVLQEDVETVSRGGPVPSLLVCTLKRTKAKQPMFNT